MNFVFFKWIWYLITYHISNDHIFNYLSYLKKIDNYTLYKRLYYFNTYNININYGTNVQY